MKICLWTVCTGPLFLQATPSPLSHGKRWKRKHTVSEQPLVHEVVEPVEILGQHRRCAFTQRGDCELAVSVGRDRGKDAEGDEDHEAEEEDRYTHLPIEVL